jgi:2-oxoglutarate ferredoxin oxidoreductase subunit alpha
MNLGQLSTLLRARYLADVRPVTSVSGLPFKAAVLEKELISAFESLLEGGQRDHKH